MTRPSWKWVKFSLFIIGGLAVLIGVRASGVSPSDVTPERMRTYFLSFGWWAPVMYGLAYAQPVVPLPASVMWMAAGLAFGLAGGLAIAIAAATIRGCGQFLIARLLGREAIETILKGRLASIDDQIGRNGFWAVLWIRMVPNVPYDLQNFWLGFSKVPLRAFIPATLLGLVPGAFLWVYLGHTLTDLTHLWKVFGALLGVGALLYAQRRYRARHVP